MDVVMSRVVYLPCITTVLYNFMEEAHRGRPTTMCNWKVDPPNVRQRHCRGKLGSDRSSNARSRDVGDVRKRGEQTGRLRDRQIDVRHHPHRVTRCRGADLPWYDDDVEGNSFQPCDDGGVFPPLPYNCDSMGCKPS